MAKKKEQELVTLSENGLKKAILRLDAIEDEQAVLDKEFTSIAAEVLSTLEPKEIRQYDQLKCIIMQNMNRGVSWKAEATILARKLYPTVAEFGLFLRYLVRKYKRKPGKPFVKLFHITSGEED